MKMYNIYALIDPRNGNPFYIGATVQSLEKRLTVHLTHKHFHKKSSSLILKRYELIKSILDSGLKIKIQLLEKASIRTVDAREEYYYSFFTERGIVLFQSKSFFNYSLKNGPKNGSYKIGFKDIGVRLSMAIYKKLEKECSADNRRVSQKVRIIIDDYFKNKHKIK